MVICKNNEFFRRLCGKDSKFAESSQKTILLKEDDADALEEVLRKIYGCTLQPADKRSWQCWSKLVVTADKYLEPQLSKEAQECFRAVAQLQTDGDVIFDIIKVIKSDMSHIRGTAKLAESLRKDKLDKLLDNERYRALLDADKGLLWSHLDEIKGAAALVKKQHYLCPHHTN